MRFRLRPRSVKAKRWDVKLVGVWPRWSSQDYYAVPPVGFIRVGPSFKQINPGDWLIEDDGAYYPVPPKEFRERFVREAGGYHMKTYFVDAFEFRPQPSEKGEYEIAAPEWFHEAISIPERWNVLAGRFYLKIAELVTVELEPGDFVMRLASGAILPLKPEPFHRVLRGGLMPSLADHHSSEYTKLLLIGDSGGGKTGALASLAKAGYQLRVLDCDNGLDILANLLSSDRAALSRVQYVTVTEPIKAIAGTARIERAEGWTKCMNALSKWPDDGSTPSEWGPDTVLAIDSLTFLSKYAMNHVLMANQRLNAQPWEGDWNQAQNLIRKVLEMLYSDSFKCNVVMNCHITHIGRKVESLNDKGEVVSKEEDIKGYPMSLGKALSPTIGTYFNHALMARSRGSGAGAKRILHTNTQGIVELKTAAPGKVKSEYPIETGLADYFRDVRGSTPKAAAA